MAQKMMEYLKEQPAVWGKIVKEREEIFRELKEYGIRPVKRILLIGSGSSYIASMAAADFMENILGIETTAAVPTRLNGFRKVLKPEDTLVIASSQSGKSTSTISAVKEWREHGFTVITATSDPKSPVALHGSMHQLIPCGEEAVGPKTKGMTGTVLTLSLMGLILGQLWNRVEEGQFHHFLDEINKSIEAAPFNIEASMEFCKRNEDLLSSMPHFTLISEEAGYYAAQEGALKILETLYVPAAAYEFEEYLHGINNTIEPGMCNLFLPAGTHNSDRMAVLERYSREKGCINFVITSLDWERGSHVLNLTGSREPYFSMFQALLAFQVMSVYGSERKCIECDTPKFHDFYQVMNTKA
ncbi:SIS domain-containing protein [Lacrimispora indolis]|mgnify:CR=1 FL=1|uniref:SIS domain-containing protein n=1 Tax=Lacrimispora indolis TaxID=69825 RepID=UPI0003FFFD9F|nr:MULTISPECIES: SIS domain-containing protein [Lachnospiraceae]